MFSAGGGENNKMCTHEGEQECKLIRKVETIVGSKVEWDGWGGWWWGGFHEVMRQLVDD